MANKGINVDIDGKEIPVLIRRMKKKEMKGFLDKTAAKVDEFAELFTGLGKGNDVGEKMDVSKFIYNNLEFICEEVIKPFTTLTSEQIDEMDISELMKIVRMWLDYNGINTGAIEDFLKQNVFSRFFQIGGTDPQTEGTLSFNGTPLPLLQK